jgi:hypothetical protein
MTEVQSAIMDLADDRSASCFRRRHAGGDGSCDLPRPARLNDTASVAAF